MQTAIEQTPCAASIVARVGLLPAGAISWVFPRPISPDDAIARATWWDEPLRNNVEETAEGSSSHALPVGLAIPTRSRCTEKRGERFLPARCLLLDMLAALGIDTVLIPAC
jgi:hypothetical protein